MCQSVLLKASNLAVLALLPIGSDISQDRAESFASTYRHEGEALLVATLNSGEIEMHWIPPALCERIASELAAGSSVSGVRIDGTKVFVAKANCSVGRMKLAAENR
jgi:hypothetical protein